MWTNFIAAWLGTWEVASYIFGGLAALVLALLVLIVFISILVAALSMLFDRITGAMAKRWEKTGRRPAARWAEIIARGHRHEE